MSFRIGFDLDGTLADLSTTYREFETRLFGPQNTSSDEAISDSEDVEAVAAVAADGRSASKARLKQAREDSSRQSAVWKEIKETADFWTVLRPLEPGVVGDLYTTAIENKWEVFFITQRPPSAGATVQLQTQRWLIAQGFETPSVLTLSGSRGKAASALELDFLVDDLPKNCVDVLSDSRCRPILVLRRPDTTDTAAAARMNIGVVASVAQAIELLKKPNGGIRESRVASVLRKLGLSR